MKSARYIPTIFLFSILVAGCDQNDNDKAANNPTSVDRAFDLCRRLDATGLLSGKCEVSGFGRSVDIHADMTPAEARKLCTAMKTNLGGAFDAGWSLKIYSPFSGKNTIAFCDL